MKQTKEKKVHQIILQSKGGATLDEIIEKAGLPSKQSAMSIISRLQKKLGGEINKKCDNLDGKTVKSYSIDTSQKPTNGVHTDIIYTPSTLAKEIKHLSSNEKKIMSFLEDGSRLTVYDITEKTGIFRQNVLRSINSLRSKGAHIDMEETGEFAKKVYYIPSLTLDSIVGKVWADIPKTSLDNPYDITIADSEHPKIMAINTPYIGAISTDNPFRHPVKNALRHAEADNIDAIILTGNSIFIDLMRYSSLKPYRSSVSGIKTNSKFVQYPDAVVESGRSPEEQLQNNKPVYVTFKERLDHVVEMAKYIFNDEKGNPLYNGPIYLRFGNKEEALSVQQTNEIVRINKDLEQEYIREQLNSLSNYRKNINNIINDRVKKFTSKHNINHNHISKKGLENIMLDKLKGNEKNHWIDIIADRDRKDEEIKEWVTYRSRVIMSNTNDEFINLCSKTMQAYIIKELSGAIPNSKFLSIGNAHIRLGENTIKVVY